MASTHTMWSRFSIPLDGRSPRREIVVHPVVTVGAGRERAGERHIEIRRREPLVSRGHRLADLRELDRDVESGLGAVQGLLLERSLAVATCWFLDHEDERRRQHGERGGDPDEEEECGSSLVHVPVHRFSCLIAARVAQAHGGREVDVAGRATHLLVDDEAHANGDDGRQGRYGRVGGGVVGPLDGSAAGGPVPVPEHRRVVGAGVPLSGSATCRSRRSWPA